MPIPQGPPAFFGATAAGEPQMVDLNLVAVDSHERPVTDLGREELTVVDAGKPQTIVFFRHRDESLAPPPHLELGEASNRGRENVPRATLILFDMLNQRFGTRGRAANRLVHDLQPLESTDYVYLYGLSLEGKLFPIHGLPGPDEQPPLPGGAPWTGQIKSLMDRAMHDFSQLRPVDEELDPIYRTQITYLALDAAATELSRAPGRKSLVWVTDGVPIELGSHDFTPQLRQMADVFDRFGVSIYPVRQVMMGSPDSMGGPGATGLGSIDTLAEFAGLTGGRPDSGKDIGAAVRQAITDARTSYQVGYYPPASNWDGKFHKLQATCSRKGVRIQVKSGYYAYAEPAAAGSQRAIASTVKTTFDAAEIGLRAAIARDEKDARILRLSARIDARDLAWIQTGAQYKADLRYAMIGYASALDPKIGPIQPLDVTFTAEEKKRAQRDGIPLAINLSLAPEIAQVRLALYDRESHALGSVTVPVPALVRR